MNGVVIEAPLNSIHHTHNGESYKLSLLDDMTNTYKQVEVPIATAEEKGYNQMSDAELRELLESNQQIVPRIDKRWFDYV